MSWSVNTSGSIADVKAELERQLSFPLADGPAGLPDEREKETVRKFRDAIFQCLDTFEPTNRVSVSASGHMGFAYWEPKTGAYQQVNVSIQPIS